MKLMLMGYARHGKDTAAEYLAKHHDITFASSSYVAASEVILPKIRQAWSDYSEPGSLAKPALPNYGSLEECFADRVNYRAYWHEAIKEFNTPDLAALARIVYRQSQMYCGIRCRREFGAIKNAGLFDFAIWVDRSLHEPAEDASSCTVEPWMADYILDNNADLTRLYAGLDVLMATLRRKYVFMS